METKTKHHRILTVFCLLPAALVGLFYLLKGNRAVMDFWVYRVAGPVEQALGRFWAVCEFSALEALGALAVLCSLLCLIYALVRLVNTKNWGRFGRLMAGLLACWLWLFAALCWMWNAAYYASTFSQRSGFTARTYSVEELAKATDWFAQKAGEFSTQVKRDEAGHFDEDLNDLFHRSVRVYDNISEEFPLLDMEAVEPKPFLLSPVQSRMGFTGMYSPFTGEANVNVAAPLCLIPSTMAHELAHQRMVSSEQEASFLGITAGILSDDPAFQYSCYLSGLINLCNALYPLDPEGWQEIVQRNFTKELAQDWNDNNAYWAALAGPVDEAAGNAYDAFLKHNDQKLGMQSYGACVDLLMAYFLPKI